jgi:hypothetical protein
VSLPDGEYRFVELYCDEPGCECRRVVILVWDESDRTLATINYGWESEGYYLNWMRHPDLEMAKEMASATLERFGTQTKYAPAFLRLFEEVIEDPGYLAKLRDHYAHFRASVAAPLTRSRRKARGFAAGTGLAVRKEPKEERSIYQLKITLGGIRPPIWRRVQVDGSVTLAVLHQIFQIAMGWEGVHLHCFRVGQVRYSSPAPDTDFEDSGDESDEAVRLNEIARREKAKFVYEYDFGDGWEHAVLVEKIMEPEAGCKYPVCVAGQRACPPEDCGGPYGYLNYLEAMADPSHEAHEEMKEWIGDDWDAEAFDLEEVNTDLRRLMRHWKKKGVD